MSLAVLLAGAVLLQSPQTLPRSADGGGPETDLGEIVVQGRQLDEAVETFVTTVSAPNQSRGPARWHRSVCIGVVGMRSDAAQAIVDGISARALAVGLVPGDPGCEANVVIFASDDGRRTATELVEGSRKSFRTGFSGSDRGNRALRDFQQAERPIRWWHVGLPVNPDTGRSTQRPRGAAPRNLIGDGTRPSDFGSQVSVSTLQSLLRDPVRDDLKQVIVVVDVDEVSSLTITQLTDYLALVALAQIDPDAEIDGYGSIVNVFDPAGTPPEGLTAWDLAYLKALYGSELAGGRVVGRATTVASAMTRDLRDETP